MNNPKPDASPNRGAKIRLAEVHKLDLLQNTEV